MNATLPPQADDKKAHDEAVYMTVRSRLTDGAEIDELRRENVLVTIVKAKGENAGEMMEAARVLVEKLVGQTGPDSGIVVGDTNISMPSIKYRALRDELNQWGTPKELPPLH